MDDIITGQIYYDDNLNVLKKLENGSIDLIYIDPPFNTGKKQSRTQLRTTKSDNGNRKGFKGNIYETVSMGTKEYDDDFGDGFIEEFLKPRLLEAYRILADYGSFYFHIDYREVHYCKMLLDEIFGRDCFLNEIIWAYDYGAKSKTRWPAKHDNILLYVKNSDHYVFNSKDIDREPYMAPGLVGPEKAEKGKLPTDTWWHTIVGTSSKERTGYPTQKPLGVINRIVQASSLPGQTVLDFFAGSGTIGESCLRLGRKFILVDNNPVALEVMAKRFPKSQEIEWINFDPAPFQLDDKGIIPSEKESVTPDFELMASLAKFIRNDLEGQSVAWESSPFSWVLQLPAAKKGKLGKQLIYQLCAIKGLAVEKSSDSEADMMINGHRVEVRFSTLWESGVYKFQQIRDEDYEYSVCLGISPFDVHCWVLSKEILERYVIGHLGQHTGSNSKETAWITVNPITPPEWISPYGGTLNEAFSVLKKLGRKR